MAVYWLKFGTTGATTYSGLAPTLTVFKKYDGTVVTAPGITQPIANYGLYQFEFSASFSVVFEVDGATTGLGPTDRFIYGSCEALDATNFGATTSALGSTVSGIAATLVAQGSTVVGIGTTLVAQGSTVVGIGTTLIAQGATIVGIGTTLIAEGSTLLAIGNTLAAVNFAGIGSTASTFGSTSADPDSLFGYLKRIQELIEGNQDFNKSTGAWEMWSRGSSTMLRLKTLTNSTTGVTKV